MENIKKEIYSLETKLLEPKVRMSKEDLDKLLAEDLKEFGSSGLVYSKKDILERLPSSTSQTSYEISDFEINQLSEDVIMANFKTDRIMNGEKSTALRTSLWRKNGNTWQMFFHQGTPIK